MRQALARYLARSQRGVLIIAMCLWGAFALLEFWLGIRYGWMNHDRCFATMGCNRGPFGFDALVHLTSGLATGAFFALHVRGSLKEKTLRRHFWDLLVFGFCVVLAWELLEWVGDLMDFGTHVTRFLEVPNARLQLSRADTLGDIVFGSLGTFAAGALGIAFRKGARETLRRLRRR